MQNAQTAVEIYPFKDVRSMLSEGYTLDKSMHFNA